MLFSCIVCKKNLGFKQNQFQSFPLCLNCKNKLISAPPLCPSCAHPVCPQQKGICSRPWITQRRIHSYSARYLLFDGCYTVLKKWKTFGGHLFHRQILKSNPSLLKQWQEFHPQAVTFIPQRPARSWKMKGGRTHQISKWVSQELEIPLLDLLQFRSYSLQRQAQLTAIERFQNNLKIEGNSNPVDPMIQNIILVDDFMTTGRTLHQGALALHQRGIQQVHAFCLGMKVPLFNP